MSVEPHIPLALWVSLALGAAALLAWYAASGRRRLSRGRWSAIVSLMAVAVAIPLVLLLNPVQVRPVPPPKGRPLLTLLVDRSASMATTDANTEDESDAGSPTSRYEQACRRAARVAERLANRYEVQITAFDEQTKPSSSEALQNDTPNGPATDLASAIEDVLVDRPQGQAVLVLSDGAHNTTANLARIRESVSRAKAMDVPLMVNCIGRESEIDDLAVSLKGPQELAFVGQRVPVVVRLKPRGKVAAETKLSLRLDGKTLEERKTRLMPGQSVEATFHVTQEKTGLYRYEVCVEPIPGEATEVNNTATLLLRVVDEPIRVLLLEGKPYWDTKFLIRTLSMDKSIELVSLVRMAEGRFMRRTISHDEKPEKDSPEKDPPKNKSADKEDAKTTPGPGARVDRWAIQQNADEQLGSRESLDQYQIVVLGRDADVFLSDDVLIRLKKWLVEGEGSLVCFRGSPSSRINQRLAELMPVRWTPSRETRFRVEMSEAGKALQWLAGTEGNIELANLPSLATVARAEHPKPLAVVLATMVDAKAKEPVPVISYQPVGNGRVVVIEGAGMWRWAFLPAQYEQHDESYGILWRSLVRWLVSGVGMLPSQEYALRTDKVTFSTSEAVTATLLADTARSTEVPKIRLSGTAIKEPRLLTPTPSGNCPGQFRVVFGRLGEGNYKAQVEGSTDTSASAAFDVRGNLTERLDVAAKADVLAWIAENSGAVVLDEADPDRLAKYFDDHLERSRPQRNSRRGLWDRWWILVVALGLWGTSWGLRRTSGLT